MSSAKSKLSVQDLFFSKDNISSLNRQLLDKYNLNDISKDGKKQIIDLLIKNMKSVFRSIDQSKIGETNIKSIFGQFNKICIDETTKSLRTIDVLSLVQPNAAELKFQRDFKSNPTAGNKVMDRPQPVGHKINQQNYLYPEGYEGATPNNLDDKFDRLFKPIVDNPNNNYQFNQYQYGKGTEELSRRIEDLQAERNNEVSMGSGRPRTPDFLKPIKTQPDRPGVGREDFTPMKSGKPDFTRPLSDTELRQGTIGTLNDDAGDLYNISNIDRPLDIPEMLEDGRSFEQRLKSLQSDRSNITIPKNNGKVNFQNDADFRQNDLDQIPDFQPKSVEQIRQEQQRQGRPDETEYKEVVRNQEELIRNNINKTEIDNRQLNLKKIQDSLKRLGINTSNLEEMNRLKEEMNILKEENELLKERINEVENLKSEISEEFNKLSQRNDEISKKESEIKKVYERYQYMFGLAEIQLDISPQESLSDYTFNFEEVDNIIGIKLLSYSVPMPRYNIEQNKNNTFKIQIDGEDKEYKLNNGKYKIEDILRLLSNKTGLKFSLNIEEKVEIESETEFNIIPTLLSKEVLGFIDDCENEKSYIATQTWDLRVEDKIYLFIKNLDETTPLGVLYINNQAKSEFKFENPITLNKLELMFRDSKGRPYNFYGLNYNVNIQLQIKEELDLNV
jgi:hypothetical protein